MFKETFLSLNHQILTTDGWLEIEDVKIGENIISFVNGKFVSSPILQTSSINHHGYAYLIDNEVKLIGHFHIAEQFNANYDFAPEKCKFEGMLFSFKTRTNSIIVRYESAQYINLLCVT